jgi:hypothetical protein
MPLVAVQAKICARNYSKQSYTYRRRISSVVAESISGVAAATSSDDRIDDYSSTLHINSLTVVIQGR